MATRSTIMVAIPKEFRGKTFHYVPKEETHFEFETPEVTIPEDAKFVEVYHHWDGYVEGLGRELIVDFNGKGFEYVMEHLIAGGDLSTTYCPYHAWRDEEWDSVAPNFSDREFKISEEYQYFMDENGKWFFRDEYKTKKWSALDEYDFPPLF